MNNDDIEFADAPLSAQKGRAASRSALEQFRAAVADREKRGLPTEGLAWSAGRGWKDPGAESARRYHKLLLTKVKYPHLETSDAEKLAEMGQ